jgi:hypothetical protein
MGIEASARRTSKNEVAAPEVSAGSSQKRHGYLLFLGYLDSILFIISIKCSKVIGNFT